MPKKVTTEHIIARFIQQHGDRYDYSSVEYITARDKVRIYCSVHGMFTQFPSCHSAGAGCKICSDASKGRKTRAQFIADAIEVHGSRYNYSAAEYVTNYVKVSIECTEHGIFRQTPKAHLRGQGCQKCSSIRTSDKLSLTPERFLGKVKDKHTGYLYCLDVKVAHRTQISIRCATHGIFSQKVNNHLFGKGCRSCGMVGPSKGELSVRAFIESLL